jgi:hypothetical protein
MSETIPHTEASDDPLRTGALSKRSDAEKAQRRADAEARRAARNVELMAMRAELATLWRVVREFIAARFGAGHCEPRLRAAAAARNGGEDSGAVDAGSPAPSNDGGPCR